MVLSSVPSAANTLKTVSVPKIWLRTATEPRLSRIEAKKLTPAMTLNLSCCSAGTSFIGIICRCCAGDGATEVRISPALSISIALSGFHSEPGVQPAPGAQLGVQIPAANPVAVSVLSTSAIRLKFVVLPIATVVRRMKS
jgi:hypothetical protein